jgi:hypothetical protein
MSSKGPLRPIGKRFKNGVDTRISGLYGLQITNNKQCIFINFKFIKFSLFCKQMSILRHAMPCLATLVLGIAQASAAPPQTNIDTAIAEANAMVKLGIPTQVIDAWLLRQVKGAGTSRTATSAVTVQTPPPSWDVYAAAAWTRQERGATGSDELQRENVYTRTRLGLSSADQDLPHVTSGQALEIDQGRAQASNTLPARAAAH